LAELPGEIDEERARTALKRASQRLTRMDEQDLNLERARAAMMRASTRLEVCQDRGMSRAPGR
ncbi:MAG: ATP synthase delta/epsilon chain alpha-helix domain-containing protein, partial [Acidobacteriota bacterium]